MSREHFEDLQRSHHHEADARHFEWQTRGPYFAGTEARLLSGVSAAPGERLLEIGCGEGANLVHLRCLGARCFGVDSSLAKAAFARRHAGAFVARADAAALPFPDGSFETVLIRDLLHHLPDRLAALREAYRVLRPGGRLHLIEPNGRSPLALMQAALVEAERGTLRSTRARLIEELGAAGFLVCRAAPAQPLPIERVALHPRMGRPGLGAHPLFSHALVLFSELMRKMVPRALWFYLTCEAVRPGSLEGGR